MRFYPGIQNLILLYISKINFALANSADPEEILQHDVTGRLTQDVK